MNKLLTNKQKLYNFIASLLFVCASFNTSIAQNTFTKVDNLIQDANSGFTILSADLNNDQQDDLVFFEGLNQIVVQLNNALGTDWKKIEGPIFGSNVWAGLVLDLNKDGFKEIVCGNVGSEIRAYTFNHIDESFSLYWEAAESFFVQNMNAVDINNDGHIDIFACNDTGENYFFVNDGAGGLDIETIIDFTTSPVSNKSGNYGSQFIDFDLDGDEDLYVSKCSAFADDPADPRRINQLFVNDGAGNFEDKSLDYNLAIGAQTWVSDFADIDLDGDLDIIVANHETELMLMENINNETFVEIQDGSGIDLFNSFWDLAFHDIDNDGYEDIILTGIDMEYYHNNGDKTFSKQAFETNANNIKNSVFTMGDFNADGFWDIIASYGTLGDISVYPDSIYMNNGNSNHWITLQLEGVISAKDPAGTRVELIRDGSTQNRILRYGRSYGVMHSPRIHFGLGDNEQYDEIKIYWKDGTIESFTDLEVDTYHYVKQGTCNRKVQGFVGLKDDIVCLGEAYELEFTGSDFTNWNTGETESEIIREGNEVVFAQYGTGACKLNAHTLFPVYADTSYVQKTGVLDEGIYKLCEGEMVLLTVPDSFAVWNDDIVSNEYESTFSGDIQVVYSDGCNTTDLTYSREALVGSFDLTQDYFQIATGEDVTIETSDENTRWYNTETEIIPFYTGADYTLTNIQQAQEIFVESYVEDMYASSVGELEPINGGYPGSSINAGTYFTVYEDIVLKSIQVHTDVPGYRSFLVRNLITDAIVEVGKDLVDGENKVELDFTLAPGSYLLKTSEFYNNMAFGQDGPILQRHTNTEVSYPYFDAQETIEITANTFDVPNAFYFFYNWKIEALNSKVCIGERQSVIIETTNYLTEETISIEYTNPAHDQLVITAPINEMIEIYSITGQKITSQYHVEKSVWNVTEFSAGYYVIRVGGNAYPLIIE